MADVLRKGASLQLVVTPPGQRRVGVYSGWGRHVVATCAADEWVPFQYAAGRHAHVITPVGYMGENYDKVSILRKNISRLGFGGAFSII